MSLHPKVLDWWWNTYSATCLGVFNRMPDPLKTSEKIAMCNFIGSQLLSGNWDKKDDFVHYGLQTENNSLTGWKMKTQTAVNAPIHTPGSHINFNGTTQYVNSNFNPTNDGNNYKLNDAFHICFIKNDNNAFNVIYASSGVDTPPNRGMTYIMHNANLTGYYSPINDSGIGTRNPTGDVNFTNLCLGGGRYNATDYKILRNGLEFNYVGNVGLLPNDDFFIGGLGRNGSLTDPFNGDISSWAIGGFINFDFLNYYNNLIILNAALAAV